MHYCPSIVRRIFSRHRHLSALSLAYPAHSHVFLHGILSLLCKVYGRRRGLDHWKRRNHMIVASQQASRRPISPKTHEVQRNEIRQCGCTKNVLYFTNWSHPASTNLAKSEDRIPFPRILPLVCLDIYGIIHDQYQQPSRLRCMP